MMRVSARCMLAHAPGVCGFRICGAGCRSGESELAFSHADGEAHGRLHIGGVGLVAAGDIEGGAVIDGSANDGQAERNIYAAGRSL